jgi:hypothetical protein
MAKIRGLIEEDKFEGWAGEELERGALRNAQQNGNGENVC